MKTKIAMLMMAVTVLFLLTAATTEHPAGPTLLSEQHMLTTVGGELFNCALNLASEVQNCQGKTDYEGCVSSAGNSYFWCRVYETVFFIFDLIF